MSSRTAPLVEGGILSGLTVIIALLGIYVPVLQAFTNIINALPIIILVVRHGVKNGVIAAVVAAVLITILANPLNGLLFFVGLAPLSLVLGWSFKEHKPMLGIILGAVVGFFAQLLLVVIALQFLQIDMLSDLIALIYNFGDMLINAYKQTNVDETGLNEFVRMVKEGELLSIAVMPTMLFIMTFMMSYVNFWLARITLRRIRQPVDDFPAFQYWDLPKSFFYAWGVSFAAWQAGAYVLGTQSLTYRFSLNCFVFFSWALFLQGFAVLSFFLVKYRIPKILRILVALLAISIPLINLMVIYGGGVDMFVNYRQLQRKA